MISEVVVYPTVTAQGTGFGMAQTGSGATQGILQYYCTLVV